MATFSVVNNISAMQAQVELYSTNTGLSKTLSHLSSGLRITNSGDDAAGLAIANKYRSEISMLKVGVRNANDGLSDLQIKDGALNNIAKLLDRAKSLASQGASGTFGALSGDYTSLNSEFKSVIAEIDREAKSAGMASATTSLSVYLSDGANGTVSATISNVDITALAVDTLTVDNVTNAATAVSSIASALNTLGSAQGYIGAAENRLSFAIDLSQSQIVNKGAAESRIRDANMAEESANLTRFNILSQSGIASLAQANQSSSSVLSLLR